MKIIGVDEFEIPGLPVGTVVKWIKRDAQGECFVRHTREPLPERLWSKIENYPKERSYLTVEEYEQTKDGPVELDSFWTPFVTTGYKSEDIKWDVEQ